MKKLSRNELKTVKGGYMQPPGSCSGKCLNGTSVSCSGSSCTASDANKTIDGSCSADGKTVNC